MDRMTANLMNWLKSPPKVFEPFYIVVGEEGYLIDEIRRVFLNHAPLGEEGMMDFNRDDVDGSKITGSTLVSLGETLPLMAEKRLIFCREAQILKEKDWEIIVPFMEKKLSSSLLVFFFDKIDKRKKHFKFLTTEAVEFSANSVREWERGPWINYMAQKEGLSFAPSAQSLFEQLSGTNLLQLNNEIKKLKSYIGEDKSQIKEEDILSVISRTKIDSVFELAAAIGRKDRIKSLECLAHLLDNNQNEIGALALVARHIRILARIHEGWKQGLSKQKLTALAGVPPFFLPEYSNQAKLWSENQIKQTMNALYETEKALKSSPLASHIWLEILSCKSAETA